MDTPVASPIAPLAPPPSVGQLFGGFLALGLNGFGGVVPLARHMIVERRRWMSPADFMELLGLCQFMPGGNIINLSVAIGMQFRGIAGAGAALLGLITAPTLIVVLLGMVYDRFRDDPQIRHLFAGLAAAAAGLLIAMAVRIALPIRAQPVPMAIAALCFVAVAVLRLPLLPTMLALASLSMAITWRRQR